MDLICPGCQRTYPVAQLPPPETPFRCACGVHQPLHVILSAQPQAPQAPQAPHAPHAPQAGALPVPLPLPPPVAPAAPAPRPAAPSPAPSPANRPASSSGEHLEVSCPRCQHVHHLPRDVAFSVRFRCAGCGQEASVGDALLGDAGAEAAPAEDPPRALESEPDPDPEPEPEPEPAAGPEAERPASSGGHDAAAVTGRLCSVHPVAALYACAGCGNRCCEECVETERYGREQMIACKECGGPCAELVPEGTEVIRGYWAELPRVFLYPFRGHGGASLAAGGVFFGILGALNSFNLGGAAVVGTVFLNGYLAAYWISAIECSSNGEANPPGWPAFFDWWESILKPLLFVFLCGLASYTPLVAYAVVAGASLSPWILLALLLMGTVYFPMALLAVVTTNSLGALDPRLVFGAIARVPGEYAVTCLGLGVTVVLGAIAQAQAQLLIVAGAFGKGIALPLVLGGVVLAGLFSIYFLLVQARLIGLLHAGNAERIDFFGRSTEERPAVEAGGIVLLVSSFLFLALLGGWGLPKLLPKPTQSAADRAQLDLSGTTGQLTIQGSSVSGSWKLEQIVFWVEPFDSVTGPGLRYRLEAEVPELQGRIALGYSGEIAAIHRLEPEIGFDATDVSDVSGLSLPLAYDRKRGVPGVDLGEKGVYLLADHQGQGRLKVTPSPQGDTLSVTVSGALFLLNPNAFAQLNLDAFAKVRGPRIEVDLQATAVGFEP